MEQEITDSSYNKDSQIKTTDNTSNIIDENTPLEDPNNINFVYKTYEELTHDYLKMNREELLNSLH